MNPIDPNDAVPVAGFNGLFSRGVTDAVPNDHLSDCLNVVYPGPNQVKTREGTTQFFNAGGPSSTFFQASVTSNNLFMLTMSNHILYTNGVLLHDFTASGADDFCALNVFGRVYICPTVGGGAVPGEFLYYYDGTNFTKAGSDVPITGAFGVTSLIAGNVTPGVHYFAVIYQTRTGFQSQPSAPISVDTSALGGQHIFFGSVPVSPDPAVVARHILMTKANETEFFFAPDGFINDNTTTTVNINDSDLDLTVSADYLFDIISRPPAAADLKYYKARMILLGPYSDPYAAYASRQVDPESFDPTIGKMLPPNEPDGNSVRTAYDLRDTLYIVKFAGVFAYEDNGDDPRNWPLNNVDRSVGCFARGKANFTMAEQGTDSSDFVIIASAWGVYLFDGVFRHPPLSWKIDTLWRSIVGSFFQVSAAKDVSKKRVYFCIPLNGATCDTILMMDYTDGLNASSVKWSIVNLPTAPRCIGMALLGGDTDAPAYTLRISTSGSSTLSRLTDTATDDAGTAIVSYIKIAPFTKFPGSISVFTAIRSRIVGSGTLVPTISKEDNSGTTALASWTLTSSANDFFRALNLESEKLNLKLGLTSGYFSLNRIDVFSKIKWMTRPQ